MSYLSKRTNINARAKKIEREVQQYLWPGSCFAGGAKRPALEQEDVRGDDCNGRPLWGEVKNWDAKTIAGEGGHYSVLRKAYNQATGAIESNPQDYTVRPKAFSVLWPKGSRKPEQKLAMVEVSGELIVMTLEQFKRTVVDNDLWNDGR